MTNDAQVAVELAKTLESFVQQQSILIQKLVGVVPTIPAPAAVIPGEGVGQFDRMADAQTNSVEEGFGESWDEDSLARHFGEAQAPKKAPKKQTLRTMSKSEIDALPLGQLDILVKAAEAEDIAEENSTDIYKVKARVANLAREGGGALTAQGDILCNTFVHMLKSLYDFADTLEDSNTRIKLRQVIRSHENVPGLIISAASAGVRNKR